MLRAEGVARSEPPDSRQQSDKNQPERLPAHAGRSDGSLRSDWANLPAGAGGIVDNHNGLGLLAGKYKRKNPTDQGEAE